LIGSRVEEGVACDERKATAWYPRAPNKGCDAKAQHVTAQRYEYENGNGQPCGFKLWSTVLLNLYSPPTVGMGAPNTHVCCALNGYHVNHRPQKMMSGTLSTRKYGRSKTSVYCVGLALVAIPKGLSV
jgi:hypothetical protein